MPLERLTGRRTARAGRHDAVPARTPGTVALWRLVPRVRGRRSRNPRLAISPQPVEEGCGGGRVAAGHVAVVALGLRVGRLLLLVGSRVFLQIRLGELWFVPLWRRGNHISRVPETVTLAVNARQVRLRRDLLAALHHSLQLLCVSRTGSLHVGPAVGDSLLLGVVGVVGPRLRAMRAASWCRSVDVCLLGSRPRGEFLVARADAHSLKAAGIPHRRRWWCWGHRSQVRVDGRRGALRCSHHGPAIASARNHRLPSSSALRKRPP